MFIPREILKSVAFIFTKVHSQYRAVGTVFFARIHDVKAPNCEWDYAITAKHVIDVILEKSQDDIVYLRINKRNGKPQFIQTKAKHWLMHPSDQTVDVAVLPLPDFSKDLDVEPFPLPAFSRGQVSTLPEPYPPHAKSAPFMEPVGIGDDVFIAGLFSEHEGTKRNIPIVRVGNIAAMAEEPIATRKYGKIMAHLLEVRSIGGLSGSPVFLALEAAKRIEDKTVYATDGHGVFYFFGLIHGHYDEEQKRLNMGIALVVPGEKVLEVINQEKLVQKRDMHMEEMMARKP